MSLSQLISPAHRVRSKTEGMVNFLGIPLGWMDNHTLFFSWNWCVRLSPDVLRYFLLEYKMCGFYDGRVRGWRQKAVFLLQMLKPEEKEKIRKRDPFSDFSQGARVEQRYNKQKKNLKEETNRIPSLHHDIWAFLFQHLLSQTESSIWPSYQTLLLLKCELWFHPPSLAWTVLAEEAHWVRQSIYLYRLYTLLWRPLWSYMGCVWMWEGFSTKA